LDFFFFFHTHTRIHIYICSCTISIWYILFSLFRRRSSPVVRLYTHVYIYICICVREPSRRNDTGIDSFSPVYGTPGCCARFPRGRRARESRIAKRSKKKKKRRKKKRNTPLSPPRTNALRRRWPIIYFAAKRKPQDPPTVTMTPRRS
jgi:hypothetical protein